MDQTARKTATANRTRYALLCDRRRALFELHKLTEAIQTHPNYAAAADAVPGLGGMIEGHLESTACNLCGRACQADPKTLEGDVRHLYRGLSALAKVWVNLTNGDDLEPLVSAHYNGAF